MDMGGMQMSNPAATQDKYISTSISSNENLHTKNKKQIYFIKASFLKKTFLRTYFFKKFKLILASPYSFIIQQFCSKFTRQTTPGSNHSNPFPNFTHNTFYMHVALSDYAYIFFTELKCIFL